MVSEEHIHCPILLVDDDEVDIMYIQREFQKMNLSVSFCVARDGLEALNQLYAKNDPVPKFKPKLIILDLMMPKMNGIEFLKELRSHPEFDSINILVLTTSNNEQDRIITKSLKVSGYYVKDTEFADFLAYCIRLLSNETMQ